MTQQSFRTAILGCILAALEGVAPQETAVICLFQYMQEARVNDLDTSESQALAEQVERLPEGIAKEVLALMGDYEHAESLEARVAHDADRLECLIQAREYQVQGYADVQDWIDGCRAT